MDNPPFNLSLEGEGDFTLAVEAGNTLSGQMNIPVLTPGNAVTGTLNPEQRLIYELDFNSDANPADGFTVQGNAELNWEVLDGDAFQARLLFQEELPEGMVEGPLGRAAHYAKWASSDRYWLILNGEFDNATDYTLKVDAGDTARHFGGLLTPGQAGGYRPPPGTFPFVRFDLDVAEGDFYTLHVNADRSWMRDQDGFDINPQFEDSVLDPVTQRYDYYYVYWNSAQRPVIPSFTGDNESYGPGTEAPAVNVELFAGDTLRTDGGIITYEQVVEGHADSPQSIRFQLDPEDLRATSSDDVVTIRESGGENEVYLLSLSSDAGLQEPIEDVRGFRLGNITSFFFRYNLDPDAEFYTITLHNVHGAYNFVVSRKQDLQPLTSLSTDSSTSAASGSTGADTTCRVSAASQVNQRSGPGTNFEVAGVLSAGEQPTVDGQQTGADGFRWWRLENGAWVRSDVVTVAGDCDTVTVIVP